MCSFERIVFLMILFFNDILLFIKSCYFALILLETLCRSPLHASNDDMHSFRSKSLVGNMLSAASYPIISFYFIIKHWLREKKC